MKTTVLMVLTNALLMSTAACYQTGISGQVVDFETGLPINEATVSLVHVNDPQFPERRANVPIGVPVDAAGRFHIEADSIKKIQSEEALLFAFAGDYGFTAMRLRKAFLSGDYVLSLRRSTPVSGIVKTSDGVPIAGATVGIVYEDPILRGSSALSGRQYRGVYTDGEGAFATNVSFGYSFAVEAFHEDYLPAATGLFKISSNEAVMPPVELRLADGLVVSGTIVNDAGQVRGGIKVQLISKTAGPLPYAQSRAFAKKLYAQLETASDGTFSFRGVPAGKKELLVTDSRGLHLSKTSLDLSQSTTDLLIVL